MNLGLSTRFGARFQSKEQKSGLIGQSKLKPKHQVASGVALVGSGASSAGTALAQGVMLGQWNLLPISTAALNLHGGVDLINQAGGLDKLRDPK